MRTFDRQRGDKRASELQAGDVVASGRVIAIYPNPDSNDRVNVLVEATDGKRFLGSWKKSTTIRVRLA